MKPNEDYEADAGFFSPIFNLVGIKCDREGVGWTRDGRGGGQRGK